MSGTIIKTKYSSTSNAPVDGTLQTGEQAYSFLSGKMYVGDASSPTNQNNIIGGKYFTDLMDHVSGTLTSGSALIVDSSSKIDIFNVDNIRLDSNTISTTDANGNLILNPNGSGEVQIQGNFAVVGNISVSGTQSFTGQTTLQSVNVTDLTATRILFAGASGELVDDADLTYNGTELHVVGSILVDNIQLNGNTITATDTNGDIVITPNGTGNVSINTTQSLQIPKGLVGTRPTPASVGDGAIRYNESTGRFEGTVSGAWTGLGGVIDVDQDTYITAEEGSDDDTLRFYAAGVQEAYVNASGLYITDQITAPIGNFTTANIVTADITGNLEVDGTAIFNNGMSVSAGDVGIADNLNVSGDANIDGNTIIGGNLTVNGTTTTVESTVITLNDPVIKVGDGSIAAGDGLDRGVNFDWGNGSVVKTGFFGFDIQTQRFSFKPDSSASSEDYSSPWGDAQFNDLYVAGFTTTGVTTLAGLLNANGGIAVDGTAFTVADVTGNIVSAGTLNVAGAVDFDSTLNVDGAVTHKSTTDFGSTGQMKITAAGVMTHGTINGADVIIDCGTF